MTEGSSRVRLGVIGVVVMALFAALFARLWFLQVATSESFAAETKANRIRVITEPAVRGSILDRDGSGHRREQARQQRPGPTRASPTPSARRWSRASRWCSVSRQHYVNNRLDSVRYSPYQPVPIADDVSLETIVFLKERPELFPKVNVVRR